MRDEKDLNNLSAENNSVIGLFSEPPAGVLESLILKHEKSRSNDRLLFVAGDEGFEPPNAWTKTMCLTTWPIPNIYCGANSLTSRFGRFWYMHLHGPIVNFV